MAEIDENYRNGINDTHITADSDDGCDTSFENPVMKFFRGFNVSDDTIRQIQENDIMFKDLSALNETDLEMFGVKDAEIRREMVASMRNTSNQDMHFDKFIEEMNPSKYQETVYKNVRNQLRLINMTLEATQITLKASPVEYDKLVDDNVYISTLNAKALKETLKIISCITETPEESKRWNNWIYTMASIAGVSLLGAVAILRLKNSI
ncbi:uncharacterized protein LOC116338847 [Contarinia nasturtii]|uniref:uncharacterized protein LOC116338847 n=1 Tax=Contarinia nasturtii TaxID=265458 RepID=UPI0012D477A8|nr:uncharacterized protein LOC116338847 [Contarinia nasturtii]